MNDLFGKPTAKPGEAPRRITFGEVWDLIVQLVLQSWANEAKRDLLKGREQEIRLEARRDLLNERDEQVRAEERQRLLGARSWLETSVQPLSSLPATSGDLEFEQSREQIEAIALRTSMWLSTVPPAQVEQHYEAWRQELHRRLPALSAAEIERRVAEFRRVL